MRIRILVLLHLDFLYDRRYCGGATGTILARVSPNLVGVSYHHPPAASPGSCWDDYVRNSTRKEIRDADPSARLSDGAKKQSLMCVLKKEAVLQVRKI